MEKAISTCIADDILKDFLLKEKAEVLNVRIFEYDEQLEHKKMLEEGIQQGETLLLINQVKKKYARKLSPAMIADALETLEQITD